MQIVRLFAGNDGQSHFEDIALAFREADFGESVSLRKAAGPVLLRRISPGHRVTWHPAPQLQYVVMLSGQMEVEAGDGEVRRFRPGDVLLTEDLTGKGHLTRTIGGEPRVLLVVPLAEQPCW